MSLRPAPIVAVTATAKVIEGAMRVRLNAAYARALEGAGIVPLVVPPLARPADALHLLDRVDGLVLTGGEDIDPARYGAPRHPKTDDAQFERDATELALVAGARERRVPTLAICRGIQLLAVALGGTLVQDLPDERGTGAAHAPGGGRADRTHEVNVTPASRLAAALGGATSLRVNSSHHQAVDRVAPPLLVTATAPDGVIEGAETPPDDPWWVLAVQWHPEELTTTAEEWDRGLFRAFAERLVSGRR